MQISLFDGSQKFKIDKPIRLIELFGGYGSQSLGLKYLGVPFQHHKLSEWAVKSIQAYKDLHFPEDNTDYSEGHSIEEIKKFLLGRISFDYSTPATEQQIKKLSESQARKIFNNMVATKNLGSIMAIKGEQLNITETDKYCYIMTYSFPCQDLSLAGHTQGMSRNSGTRSSLLWEVERLLDECEELPQVLLMENVPEVIGTNNIKHFAKWLEKLESLGYKNKWQCLNSKYFEIPQTRNRCFMISVLGDYYYNFPNGKSLNYKMQDFLEIEVDSSFYFTEKTLNQILNWKSFENPLDRCLGTDSICPTITTRVAESQDGGINASMRVYSSKLKQTTNLRQYYLSNKMKKYINSYDDKYKVSDGNLIVNRTIASTITTREGRTRADASNYITKSLSENANIAKLDLIELEIRKLTPKECWRLMGVKDEDFEKVAKNQSNSSLYHLAGDSIVVNVLMAIFKEML